MYPINFWDVPDGGRGMYPRLRAPVLELDDKFFVLVLHTIQVVVLVDFHNRQLADSECLAAVGINRLTVKTTNVSVFSYDRQPSSFECNLFFLMTIVATCCFLAGIH